jgi:hypothetical protein
MANLKLKNPAGGSLNLVSADGASDLTVTFPATTGTAMVSGNMPAFSAYYSSGTTSISNSTWTKVNLATEEFDTNSNFASNRFTPTVSGYYQINGSVYMAGNAGLSQASVSIYKNGTSYKYGAASASSALSPFNAPAVCVSSIIYFNGSTDYVELYCNIYDSAAGPIYVGGIASTWFNGCLIRAA